MNRKFKIAVISIASAVAIACAGATAYFSDRDSQENKITVGVNTIKINEDFTPPDDVKPGDVIMKNPSVECVKEDGAVDCYVRMYCEYADSTAEDITDINFNTTDWTAKQDDGYYYYKKKLSPGESTKPLFTKVTVKSEESDGHSVADIISNVYDFDLICYAESVQAYDAKGDTYYTDYSSAWEYWNQEKEGLE